MEKYRRKEKDNVKLGKKYLIGGLGFTFLGKILLILSLSIIDSALGSSDEEGLMSIIILWFSIVFSFFFGVFYFFWGITKLRKIFKENSNIFLVYYGIISFILFMPLFLYGYLSPIECFSYGCTWRFSLIQIVMLSLGVFMFISSIIIFFYELRKIKGEILENFLSAQKEELPIEPISKKLYKIRIEKSGEHSEENIYVCGNCGDKNRFETLNEEKGLFRCLNCDSENYLGI